MTNIDVLRQAAPVSLVRAAATGAAGFGAIFVACWVGTLIPGLSPTHAFISLFSNQPVGSTAALVEGLGWAIVFGALTAVVIAFFYDLFAFLGRRA